MDQQTKDKYSITFTNRVIDFGIFGKKSRKILSINNAVVSEFFLDWNNPEELDEYLIPDIDDVLQGVAIERSNGSETISISINSNFVVFYVDNVGTDHPQIPTSDFKEIVEGWRDFLLTPPLNEF